MCLTKASFSHQKQKWFLVHFFNGSNDKYNVMTNCADNFKRAN